MHYNHILEVKSGQSYFSSDRYVWQDVANLHVPDELLDFQLYWGHMLKCKAAWGDKNLYLYASYWKLSFVPWLHVFWTNVLEGYSEEY